MMQGPILTTGDVLERAARLWPNREALVVEDIRLTYTQLDRMANQLANGLAHLGITQGDKVAVMLPNGPEFVCAYYALAKMGVVIVPMNTRFRRREVEHIVSQTEASALITADRFLGFDYVDLVAELWPHLPGLRHVIVKREKQAIRNRSMLAFDDVTARGDERAPGEMDPTLSLTVDQQHRVTSWREMRVWLMKSPGQFLPLHLAQIHLPLFPVDCGVGPFPTMSWSGWSPGMP